MNERMNGRRQAHSQSDRNQATGGQTGRRLKERPNTGHTHPSGTRNTAPPPTAGGGGGRGGGGGDEGKGEEGPGEWRAQAHSRTRRRTQHSGNVAIISTDIKQGDKHHFWRPAV